MSKPFYLFRLKLSNAVGFSTAYHIGKRMLLSQAYRCEEAWAKRLESPLLRNIKMDQYFIDTDKKFGSKNRVSGVDIDLFACSVEDADQLDELEHLLYRCRRTKHTVELMDSTTYAVIKIFLKFKNYEALFRILENPESYGIFPDLCSYNVLMDTFIEENLPEEALRIAILMMLQEDFSNEIGSLLAVHTCLMYLKHKSSLESAESQAAEEKKEVEVAEDDDEEEEQLVRVPFIRNPFFDDHFHLENRQHLIGKTLFLAGLAIKDDLLGKSCQLLGLGMYEKWEEALRLLAGAPALLSGAVEEFEKCLHSVDNDDLKKQYEDLFSKLGEENRIKSGDIEHHLAPKLKDLSAVEQRDIALQRQWFDEWEQKRRLSLEKQNLKMEVEQRLKKIAEKKEDLFWREKMLFFFENEDKILSEFELAEERIAKHRSENQLEESYIPPEIVKKPLEKKTRFQKIARVKKL